MSTARSGRGTAVAAAWADAYVAQDDWLATQVRGGIAPCGVKLATLPDGDGPVTVTGWLTSEMQLKNSACLPAALRASSIEVEVAARLGAGGVPTTRQDAIGMIASLHVAFEFVATSPTLAEIGAQQLVARNVNALAFLVAVPGLGAEQGLRELTSSDVRVTAPGGPLGWAGGTPPDVVAAVMEAGGSLARRGHRLQPGWWILTGRIGAKLDPAEVTGLTAHLGRFESVTAKWDTSRSGT
jgi:2-keto-4-pentenoate hydratase